MDDQDYARMHTAVRVALKILKGVAASDFVNDYGVRAAYGLRDYKEDIACTVFEELSGRESTDEERETLVCTNWDNYEEIGFAKG